MATLLTQIGQALVQARQEPENLRSDGRLSTPAVRRISAQYWKQVKAWEKTEVFGICEELLAVRQWRQQVIAFDWAFRCKKQYGATDFERFERWLAEYVDGWGSCDDFCSHALGSLIYQFPELTARTLAWTSSDNRWFRRAAAVVLIYSLRRDALLDVAFQTADRLLMDADDLVQKGYGWMLKEASKHAPMEVFDYVMAHKATMPRTALRYAIEKLDPDLRKAAMEK